MCGRLGNVKEKILDQLVRRSLVDPICALRDEPFELLIHLTQQGTDRGAVNDATAGQSLDHPRRDLPQRSQWRVLAKHFQASEHSSHVTQVGWHVLTADNPDQRDLQHLSQLAQQARQISGLPLRQKLSRKCRKTSGHVGREQTGFREQLLATRGAQVVK